MGRTLPAPLPTSIGESEALGRVGAAIEAIGFRALYSQGAGPELASSSAPDRVLLS